MLSLAVANNEDSIIDNFDWLLKWCTIRLCENNVQSTVKLLEFLESLFSMLDSRDYRMDEGEAAILIPFLVEKSGNPKPRFRESIRSLMKKVCNVYPTSKFAQYVVEGLSPHQKNNRTKVPIFFSFFPIYFRFYPPPKRIFLKKCFV